MPLLYASIMNQQGCKYAQRVAKETSSKCRTLTAFKLVAELLLQCNLQYVRNT